MSAMDQVQILGNKVIARGMKLAADLIPLRDPELLVGSDALQRLAQIISEDSVEKVLLVTGAGIVKRGQIDGLVAELKERGVKTVVYSGIVPDPTFAIVNEGLALLNKKSCDGVVGFGGGSAMDAAR